MMGEHFIENQTGQVFLSSYIRRHCVCPQLKIVEHTLAIGKRESLNSLLLLKTETEAFNALDVWMLFDINFLWEGIKNDWFEVRLLSFWHDITRLAAFEADAFLEFFG